jgi:hypothetical protein
MKALLIINPWLNAADKTPPFWDKLSDSPPVLVAGIG